jgi:hypothetical protein
MTLAPYPGAVDVTIEGNVCSNPLDKGIAISGATAGWSNLHDATIGNNTFPSGHASEQVVRWPFGNGNNVQFNHYMPSTQNGDYQAGDIYLVGTNPGNSQVVGEYVDTSGTRGLPLTMTAATTSGSSKVTFSSVTNLRVGGWISIDGVGGNFQLINLSGSTGTLSANAGASVTAGAVSWVAPAFSPIMPTDTRAYRVSSGSGYASANRDYYLGVIGGDVLLPSASQMAAPDTVGKQYIIRNITASSSVTVKPYSETTINRLGAVTLHNPNDFLWIQWNGANWDVLGASPTVLAEVTVSWALPSQTAISSATTIAPTAPFFHVTGKAVIATITPPSNICRAKSTMCQITMIPDGLWITTTGGNIAVASKAVVGRALTMTYDPGTSLWYPSY